MTAEAGAAPARGAPPSPLAHGVPTRGSWLRHFNVTNLLTTAFLGYAAFSLVTLYRIAVPRIPDVFTPAGVRRHAYEPLWRGAPGLALEVRLSTSPGGADESNSVLLCALRDLPYAWNLSDLAELDMSIELPEGYDASITEVVRHEEEEVVVEEEVEEEAGLRDGARSDGEGVATQAEAGITVDGEAPSPAPVRQKVRQRRTVLKRTPVRGTRTERVLLPTLTPDALSAALVAIEAGQDVALPGYAPSLSNFSSTDKNVTVKLVSPAGLRVRCAAGSDSSGTEVSPACTKAARAWRLAHAGAQAAGVAVGVRSVADVTYEVAQSVAKRGLLASLARSVRRSLAGGPSGAGLAAAGNGSATALDEAEDEEEATAREKALGGLVLFESSSDVARKVALALSSGRAVYAHGLLRWQDATQEKGGATVRSPLSPSDRRVVAPARMVDSAPYQPSPRLRYLWTDALPPPWATAFAEWVGIGKERLAKDDVVHKVGEERSRAAVRERREGARPAATAALTGGAAPGAQPPAHGTNTPHWLGSLSLSLVMQTESIPKDEVPVEIQPFIRLDATGTGYSPLLTANPVRPLRERYVPLNRTLIGLSDALPLKVRLTAVTAGTWRLMSIMDQSLTTQRNLGATERDTDDVIRLLAETPLWLLGVTFVVSFIHLLFDALAFKNDVAFWASAKSLRGISVKSLGQQVVSSVVIALYLWREGSSMLVLLPQAAGTALLVWKMAKAAGLTITIKYHVLPIPSIDQALAASATEGAASRYDAEAVGAMTSVLYPLLAGYALHQLVYARHASWLDWALGTAVSAVYGIGFALMTPQLWINYRLRSVAHLPWRVLGYRFFNTVIDDLFAAIIRMPMLHRISVFRDDVIFVIYMVQRCMYPVDTSRPAEGFEDDDETRGAASAPGGGGGAVQTPVLADKGTPSPEAAPDAAPEAAPEAAQEAAEEAAPKVASDAVAAPGTRRVNHNSPR